MKPKRYFTNTSPEPKKEEAKVVEPEKEEIKETEPEPVQEEVKEEEETYLPAVVDGVDTMLNIRKEPKVEPNNQVGILSKGTHLEVADNGKTVEGSGEKWYKVRFGDPKQDGYAMKKYIKMI